ncbi:hypothetical protein ACROYT_G008538 [Oculina patagonica]
MVYTEIEKSESLLKRSTSAEIVRFDGLLDTIRFQEDPVPPRIPCFRFVGCENNFWNLKTNGIGSVQVRIPGGCILYVKYLDNAIDDARLCKEFSAYGTVISAKVMMDDKNNSKGFGFVAFSSKEEATEALNEMNGRILLSRALYVAVDRGSSTGLLLKGPFTSRRVTLDRVPDRDPRSHFSHRRDGAGSSAGPAQARRAGAPGKRPRITTRTRPCLGGTHREAGRAHPRPAPPGDPAPGPTARQAQKREGGKDTERSQTRDVTTTTETGKWQETNKSTSWRAGPKVTTKAGDDSSQKCGKSVSKWSPIPNGHCARDLCRPRSIVVSHTTKMSHKKPVKPGIVTDPQLRALQGKSPIYITTPNRSVKNKQKNNSQPEIWAPRDNTRWDTNERCPGTQLNHQKRKHDGTVPESWPGPTTPEHGTPANGATKRSGCPEGLLTICE